MSLFFRWCIIGLSFVAARNLAAIDWPIMPQNESHPLGNSYGEFQRYNGDSYYHPGIDIMALPGTPVYAIKSGYVKAVLTTSAELHWRVAIGDSAGAQECDGWLYAHLDLATIAVSEGQWVEKGQYLGDIIYWPIAGFSHLHFVKIRDAGLTWNAGWEFIGNPLDELVVIDDSDAPGFDNAFGSQKFAFCQNESASYFGIGEELSGDVDIVCRAYDIINDPIWEVAPYKLEYKIDGDSSIPWTTSVCFTGLLDWYRNIDVVYQDDAVCSSRGDYDERRFFFNLTNTDGDSVVEASDKPLSWQTAGFHNGDYVVYARASDRYGNSREDSMTVTIVNYFTLDGTVAIADGNPQFDGTAVTVFGTGRADVTEADGTFSISMVGGGCQLVEVSRPGYTTIDTMLMMNRHHTLQLILTPAAFILGDANYDGNVNVGDVVFLVNYIFRDGAAPMPYISGDANSDGLVNVGDAVYLVNYIFRGGPPPQSH
jgi:hypothetical protein